MLLKTKLYDIGSWFCELLTNALARNTFFKVGPSRPLFIYFRLFNTVDSKQVYKMFNINFTYDWIRTADLWYWKQSLYQLSHNHFPTWHEILYKDKALN